MIADSQTAYAMECYVYEVQSMIQLYYCRIWLIVDISKQNIDGVDSSDQALDEYTFELWLSSKEIVFNLLTCLHMNLYVLYKLTVEQPKTR